MYEKRRLKRRHLIYYLRVFDRNTSELVGHLVDITAKGIMLISENPVELEALFQLKMDLPQGMGDKEQLYFDARSVWQKRDINPNFHNTGFEFRKVSRAHFVVMEQLLDDFGFRD